MILFLWAAKKCVFTIFWCVSVGSLCIFVAMCHNEMLERVIHAQRQEHPLCWKHKGAGSCIFMAFISSLRLPVFSFLIISPLVSCSPSTMRVSSYSWRPIWRMTSLRNFANTSSPPSRARMVEAAPLTPLDLEQACWVNTLLKCLYTIYNGSWKSVFHIYFSSFNRRSRCQFLPR